MASNIIHDPVNHPSHYASGAIECIDAIEASMTPEEFQGYCNGNVKKYTWRWRNKNGLEDLKKAEFYLKRLIQSVEKNTCLTTATPDYIKQDEDWRQNIEKENQNADGKTPVYK